MRRAVDWKVRRRLACFGAVLTFSLGAVACGSAGDAAEEVASSPATDAVLVDDVGFSTPESVLHDPTADVYLVSNIVGNPAEVDGDGFISRLSPSGEVLELRWIDGASDAVTLHAPRAWRFKEVRSS